MNGKPKTRLVRPGSRKGNGEPDEVELVSTQMLKRILTARDDRDRQAVSTALDTATEGILVRHPSNGAYEIIDDEEFDALLQANDGLPKLSRPADVTAKPFYDYPNDSELALVSSRALRRVLSVDDD